MSNVVNRRLFSVLLLIGMLIPFQDYLYIVLAIKILCFGLFASAFNLLLGYTGLLSFGHAAFFGSASYVTAHVCSVWGWPPEFGILAGVIVAIVQGYIIGVLAIRRQGIYFAMITLAFAQMVYFLALQLPFTHGEDGIQGVPRGHLFGFIDLNSNVAMYYFVFFIFVMSFALIVRIINSPFGQILQAIRENEPRAISLGYDVTKFKLRVFIISAGLAGLAGSIKSLTFQLASLTDVHWHMSGEVVLMTLLGGMGTLFGPLFGAAFLTTLNNYLANIGSWATIVMGCAFVICVLAFRQGVIGELKLYGEVWLTRRSARLALTKKENL